MDDVCTEKQCLNCISEYCSVVVENTLAGKSLPPLFHAEYGALDLTWAKNTN